MMHPSIEGMIPGKKSMSLKASKQTSVVASKIKNKILNTSSFFKVSLKNNNKALAMALSAEKEKSRQLEVENVNLLKQVKALDFDLAIWRHKHKQLILILKNVHSNTMDSLERALDLFSGDNDLPEQSDDLSKECPGKEDDNIQLEREAAQIVPRPQLAFPSKRTSMHQEFTVRDSTVFSNPTRTQPRPTESNASKGRTDDKDRHVDGLKSTQGGSLRQSSSLMVAVERWSQIYSEPGLESNPGVRPEIHLPSAVCTSDKPRPLATAETVVPLHGPSSTVETGPPEPDTVGEKTTLGAEMEMTMIDSQAAIIAVETKPKAKASKDGSSNGTRKKRIKRTEDPEAVREAGIGSDVPARGGENPEAGGRFSSEPARTRHSPPGDPQPADGLADGDVDEQSHAPTAASADETQPGTARSQNHFASRIPKYCRPAPGAPKTKQKEIKPFEPRKTFVVSAPTESHSNVSPEDDYFMDLEGQTSEIKDGATSLDEGTTDKVSKTKRGKTCVLSQADRPLRRETFVVSTEELPRKGRKTERQNGRTRRTKIPPVETDRAWKMETEMGDDACLELLKASVDEDGPPVESSDARCSSSSRATKPQTSRQRSKTPADPGSKADQNHVVRHRGTFLIPVTNGSISDTCADEQEGTFSTGYSESVTVRDVSVADRRHTGADADLDRRQDAGLRVTSVGNGESADQVTQASGKRPWRATQEPADVKREHCTEEDVSPWDLGGAGSDTAVQKPKKARKEMTGKSRKKKVTEKDNSVKERKKAKRSSSARGSASRHAGYDPLSETLDYQDRAKCPVSTVPHIDPVSCTPVEEDLDVLPAHSGTAGVEGGRRTEERLFSADAQSGPGAESSRACSLKAQTNQRQTLRDTFIIPCRNNNSKKHNRNTYVAPVRGSEYNGREEESDGAGVGGGAAQQSLRELLMDEPPPWDALDASSSPTQLDRWVSSPASRRVTVYEEESEIRAEPSPAGKVLTSLNSSDWMEDNAGRTRRRGSAISYKEPSINCKMRRGDKFSDTKFLSSPIYKEQRKKIRRKK